jgi:hypothetical protein
MDLNYIFPYLQIESAIEIAQGDLDFHLALIPSDSTIPTAEASKVLDWYLGSGFKSISMKSGFPNPHISNR